MSDTEQMIDCIRSLYEHSFNLRGPILEALEDIPYDDLVKDMGIERKSILGLLEHMVETEIYWTQQVLVADRTEGTEHRSYRSVQDIRSAWMTAGEKTRALLSDLNENRLLRVMSLRWEDVTVSFTVAKALLHLVIHEAHHRGQIVSLIRQLGHVPPRIDML